MKRAWMIPVAFTAGWAVFVLMAFQGTGRRGLQTDSSGNLTIKGGLTTGQAGQNGSICFNGATSGLLCIQAISVQGNQTVNMNASGAWVVNGTTEGIVSPAFTATMPVALLGAGACAAAVQVAITGVTTASVISWDFATDPSGVVGYGSSGGLTITAFGTAGNANFRQCNPTAAGITPGAMTLNVRAIT